MLEDAQAIIEQNMEEPCAQRDLIIEKAEQAVALEAKDGADLAGHRGSCRGTNERSVFIFHSYFLL